MTTSRQHIPTRGVGRVLVILLLAANLRVGLAVVAPLAGEIGTALGGGAVGVVGLVTLPLLCFGLVSPVVPAVRARIGTELALGLALALTATGTAARLLPSPVALWAGTAVMGIGIAILNVLVPALVKRDFPAHVGTLTGLFMSAQAIAAAIGSMTAIPLAGLTPWGWRVPAGVWAIVALAALGAVAVGWRTRRPAPPEAAPDTPAPPSPGPSPWTSARAWHTALFLGAQSSVYYVVLAAWPSLEARWGVPADIAGIHQGVLQLSSIAGMMICAAALRWMPRDQRPLAGSALAAAAGAGMCAASPTLCPALLPWGNAVLGIAIGVALVHALSLVGLKTDGHAEAARVSGMAQSFGYLFAAGGPLLAGALLESTAPVAGVAALVAVLLALQFASALAASRPQGHRARDRAREGRRARGRRREVQGAVGSR